MNRKFLAIIAAAALALMAFASTASATTLELNGLKQTGMVAIHASLAGSTLLTDTFGSFANTCKVSHVEGTTSTTTGPRVAGNLSALTFEECTEDAKEKVVVDEKGSLEVENISGTTHGTVFSKNAKVTTPSPFGKLVCTTPAGGIDVGKVTGFASGTALMDANAVLNCGLISAKWGGTYTITSGFNGITS